MQIKVLSRLATLLARPITAVHNQLITPGSFVAALLAVIVVRTWLELLLEPSAAISYFPEFYLSLVDYLHVIYSWLTLFVAIALWISISLKIDFSFVCRATLLAFPVIFIVPLIDYVFPSGIDISYSHTFDSFWHTWFSLFNPSESIAKISAGVRVEVTLVLLLIASYGLIMQRPLWRVILAVFGVYQIIFLFGFLPAVYSKLMGVHFSELVAAAMLPVRSGTHLYALMYLPLAMLLCTLALFSLKPHWRYCCWQLIRLERLTIYLGLLLFAILLSAIRALAGAELLNVYDLLRMLAACLSISMLFVFSTAVNDLADIAGDRISNPQRPLVIAAATTNAMTQLAVIALFFGLTLALLVNEHFFFVAIALAAFSYLYSVPPFRLKRFLGLAHAVLTLIAGSVLIAGYVVIEANLAFQKMDLPLLYSLMLFFFVASHLKDIKDVSADSRVGVTTLAGLIGPNAAYRYICVAVILVSLLSSYWLGLGLLVGLSLAIGFGVLAYWLRNAEYCLLLTKGVGFVLLASYCWQVI